MDTDGQGALKNAAGGPPELTPEQARLAVGAMSKLVSASVGDVVVVMSRAPSHEHYSLADIEWMVLPPVLADQFYVGDPQGLNVALKTLQAGAWQALDVKVALRDPSDIREISLLRELAEAAIAPDGDLA